MNKKVIGYVRVSTNYQVKNGDSVENQIQRIRDYCSLNNLELIDIKTDNGISGKSSKNRNGYREIICMIKNKEIDGVVVYSLSRWGRSVRENWESIDLMTKSNIGFYSVKEMVDTSSSMGKFILGVMNCMYQLEVEQLSERTKDVLQYKKKCGQVYSPTLYGFDRIENRLVKNKKEQRVLRLINRKKSLGQSLQKISDYLNEKNYKTKTGKQFSRHTLFYMLKVDRDLIGT